VSLGNRPGYHTILENTNSIREVQEALTARRKDVPEGAWITSMGGWIPHQWTERRQPTLAELDAAVPDRPVLLYERFTGPAVTNTLGKKFFDAADAAPPAHPEIKKKSTWRPTARSLRPDSPEADPPPRRSFSCAACRRSPTKNGARWTPCATRPPSG
jgi:predicted amidohydrolase YtcJ